MNQHVKNLIYQLLLTTLGERVNMPELGTNVNQLLLGPNSAEIAASTKLLIQGALQHWLGDIITIKTINVKNIENKLEIIIQYNIIGIQQPQEERIMVE